MVENIRRRNRRHLKKTFQLPSATSVDDDDDVEAQPGELETVEQSNNPPPSVNSPPPSVVTSRGRTIRAPPRYQDFVRH